MPRLPTAWQEQQTMMVKETEYRNFGRNDKGVFKVGFFIKGTETCLMMYNGYLVGRNADVMKLYPSRRGEGTARCDVPMMHAISIYKIKDVMK